MQNLNSDQLRQRLAKHTRKMNWLAEQNDLIVATLKQRGLQAVEKTADEDLVFSADKMILTNADGTEVFNTDRPNLFADPDLRADSRVKSPFSEEHSKAVNQPIPEELSAMISSFFKGFGHVRVFNTDGEVQIDTEWPNPLVNPDQYEAHRRMAECVDKFQGGKEDRVPLTADELKAGGWWCEKVDEATIEALIGLDISTNYQWDIGSSPIAMSTTSGVAYNHPSCFLGDGWKQIHRIGNNFYWGAP